MKWLITGGAGFIGSHLAQRLLDDGEEVLVLDNLSTGHRELLPGGLFIEGSLGDVKLLDRIFSTYRIDAVMHFAAYSLVGESVTTPLKYYRNNVAETIELSKDHTAMQINLALNYGSRMEILNAVKNIIEDGVPAKKIDDKLFKQYLYTADSPDPDLLVRTSGEQRISNFLLYQIAYSELYFTPAMWPDFRLKEFLEAILEYQKRQRRFGSL